MKSFILHAAEVRELLSKGAVTIWRPVKQMAGSCWELAKWPESWGEQPPGEICVIDQAGVKRVEVKP